MDFDLDLDSNLVGGFLASQLDEVKASTVDLEEALGHRRQAFAKYQSGISVSGGVSLGGCWKKIANAKYVVGWSIFNSSTLENFNVILDWNSPISLNYKYFIISAKTDGNMLTGSLKHSQQLLGDGLLVVVFDIPQFTHQLKYAINGLISFQTKTQTVIKIPSFTISAEDATEVALHVQLFKVIDGIREDFLTWALSRRKYQLVLAASLPWTRSVEAILEIDCSMCKINTDGNFFIANKISPLIDGTILELEQNSPSTMHCTVYYRDEDSLVALVHYLHNHISDASVIPRDAFHPQLPPDEAREKFTQALFEEIDRSGEILHAPAGSSSKIRADLLVDLEQKTDALFSQIKTDRGG